MKLAILDRDGVVNYDSPAYIKSPEEWRPIPGSLEAITRLNRAGYHVVIATNQSGVGRGLFEMATLNAIHDKMHRALAEVGGRVDGIFYCPHAQDAGCRCRKPQPGLLEEISRRLGIGLDGVPVIGDSLRDLQAGFEVGCAPYLVRTGKGERTMEKGGLPPGTQVFDNLAGVVDRLLHLEAVALETAAMARAALGRKK